MNPLHTGTRVRFDPAGFTRGEQIGEIFSVTEDELYGITYCVETDGGSKHQVHPEAITATGKSENSE